MKKELLFSFIGHIVLFAAIIGATMQKKSPEKTYPDVFQISVVSLNMGSGGFGTGSSGGTAGSGGGSGTSTAGVSFLDKKPLVKKGKISQDNKGKTTNQSNLPYSVPGGGGGGGLGLKGLGIYGGPGGRYSYYVEMILKKIGANWINPYEGQMKKFSATIYFVVHKNGQITSTKIEKGSGNELFDRSAERAVIVTNFLPPLAGEFENQDSLRLHLEFEYKP